MNDTASDPLITISEASRILGLSPEWVRHLERTGELAAQRVGGMRVFRMADVVKLAAKRAGAQREYRGRR